ncbi:FAD-binding domain-containing protein [Lentithecium fluviatile CBS 122367]|uniref:FAD-binding domain-containing protein n=1 Tax=Lentithecium fluviatile CBS 122367 TaxID=1168545 RepID=A0A6G1JDX0_9PLEO|nr:FAD-binding domain-containing protein [Lentithecium fluviatile CBS 122367]
MMRLFVKFACLSLLSNSAKVYRPGTQGFVDATARWDASTKPGLELVVMVASEIDVQHTVEFANAHNIPYLAIGGGHGGSMSLNNIRGGIGIWLRGLMGVDITNNGTEAVIQAGQKSGEVIQALWDKRKMSVTGGCDCTGFVSPVLGGGHGWLQGRYGLLTDNLLSARLVLWNGTAITVDEKTPELFWALRGAGHNFGIVTSVHYRVYDRVTGEDSFSTVAFIFRQDKLESVFTVANRWLEVPNRPMELSHFTNVMINPAIDAKPSFVFMIYWQGDAIPASYKDQIKALSPVSTVERRLTMNTVNSNAGSDFGGPACAKGASHRTYPVNLMKYNLKSLRRAVDIFATLPSPFSNSVIMLEGFATNRVEQIPEESTAYPDRRSKILASPLLTYPANDTKLDKMAFEFGKQLRTALLTDAKVPLSAYVNYANGDENNRAVYGYDQWRLQKLQGLKKRYDPKGKFSFYEPIQT